MSENTSAAEWLRGIIGRYEDENVGLNGSCSTMAKMFGVVCKEETCRTCMVKMMTAIADRIDDERALPYGVEWPRFEDGEMVKFGDEVEFEGEAAKVLDVAFSVVRFSLGVGTATTSGRVYGFLGEPAKRPAPKVLDADGAPIEVGDTVYCDDDPEPWQVDLIYAGSMGYCTVRLKDSAGIYKSADAPRLSHKKPEPPDSWERIEDDAYHLVMSEYLETPEEDVRDLVRRAKALAKADSEARGVE